MDRPKRATRNPNPMYRVLGGESGIVRQPLRPEEVRGNDISSETPATVLTVTASASTANKRKASKKRQGSRKKASKMAIPPVLPNINNPVVPALKETAEGFRDMDMIDRAERTRDPNENEDDDEPPVLEDTRLTFAAYIQKYVQVVSSPGGSEDKARNETPICSIETNAMSMNETDVEQPVPVLKNDCGLELGSCTSTSSLNVEFPANVESSEANVGVSDERYAGPAEVYIAPAEMDVEPPVAEMEPAKAEVNVEPPVAEMEPAKAEIGVELAEVVAEPAKANVVPPIAEMEPVKAEVKLDQVNVDLGATKMESTNEDLGSAEPTGNVEVNSIEQVVDLCSDRNADKHVQSNKQLEKRKKKTRVRVIPQIIELYKMLEAKDRGNGHVQD